MTGPRVLITGGAGFIGCNLADRLAGDGCRVVVLDSLARPGVERNLAWLKGRHGAAVQPLIVDVRDAETVLRATADAEAVFHFAAQVAVTTSMTDPVQDFEINLRGTLNVLEGVRRAGRQAAVIFSSTNKVYGDLADVPLELCGDAWLPQNRVLRSRGIGEQRPLDFHTPYGCSKGAADQYVLDYGRTYGVPACVLRMSCIYGRRQFGTEDQGWVAHFLIEALAGRPLRIYGDGRQVRDVLNVRDAVEAYVQAWRRIDQIHGQAFNLGGGPMNAVSLRQLIDHIQELIGRDVDVSFHGWRAGDQRYFVADADALRHALNLAAPMNWRSGVADLAEWLRSEGVIERAPQAEAAA